MQFVTASLTAVLMSLTSSSVGSIWAAKQAAVVRAKPSLAERLRNSTVALLTGFLICIASYGPVGGGAAPPHHSNFISRSSPAARRTLPA